MPPNTVISENVFSSPEQPTTTVPKRIVVVGLGMVAVTFIEKILEYDERHMYEIRVFSEEPEGKDRISVCFWGILC